MTGRMIRGSRRRGAILSLLRRLQLPSLSDLRGKVLRFLSIPFWAVRKLLLRGLYSLLTSSVLWSEEQKSRYEQVFLSDLTVEEQERALVQTAISWFERAFLRAYLQYPFPNREEGYHVDVVKYMSLHVHSFFGPYDDMFRSEVDDKLIYLYDPLRSVVAEKINTEEDSMGGKTIYPLRIARHYETVKSLSEVVFYGVTRSFDVLSDSDISNLYYDVLQCNHSATADEDTKERILRGDLSIVALSYRHAKDHREKLGLTKNEFIAAMRALHSEAEPAGASSEYCVWWDSCLKCNPFYDSDRVNWAAVGLVPYAFCHALSIRRDSEGEQDRLWINIERALGRFGKGFVAVDVTQVPIAGSSIAEVLGGATASHYDPLDALQRALMYISSGDLCESEVTFDEDRQMLERASVILLCSPGGAGVWKALFDPSRFRVLSVESLALLERRVFEVFLEVWLGTDQLEGEEGETVIDDEPVRLIEQNLLFYDRRVWLPNSPIYQLGGDSSLLPSFSRAQVALLLRTQEESFPSNRFGLLLYYQAETNTQNEAVHGRLVSLISGEPLSYVGDRVWKIHVPPDAALFKSFTELYFNAREQHFECGFSSLDLSKGAIAWLWKQIGTGSPVEQLSVRTVRPGMTSDSAVTLG